MELAWGAKVDAFRFALGAGCLCQAKPGSVPGFKHKVSDKLIRRANVTIDPPVEEVPVVLTSDGVDDLVVQVLKDIHNAAALIGCSLDN